MARNLDAFCACPKNLPETKLKNNGLIHLMEKFSRQYNVESMIRLVLIMHVQVYNTRKQVSQEEIQDAYSLERKTSLVSFTL